MKPTLRPYYSEPPPKGDQVGNEATRLTQEAAQAFRDMARAEYLPKKGPVMPPVPKNKKNQWDA